MKNLLNKKKFIDDIIEDEELICGSCFYYNDEAGMCTYYKKFVDYLENADDCKYYYD